ncbi:MAG: hypothetical protein WCT16_02570 [Candidatus Buchananbacteria bacterium]
MDTNPVRDVKDLLTEIERHDRYVRNLQFRIDGFRKIQRELGEQLTQRVRAGETLGDRILDFMVTQKDLIAWRHDGGELEHSLLQLERRLKEHDCQPVMLAQTGIEENPGSFLGRFNFDGGMFFDSMCSPNPLRWPEVFVYQIKIGCLCPGGLLIGGTKWFLPLSHHFSFGCKEEEKIIPECIPLPGLTPDFAAPSTDKFIFVKDAKSQIELLLGVAAIRLWLGQCRSERIGLRILEILDVLESPLTD